MTTHNAFSSCFTRRQFVAGAIVASAATVTAPRFARAAASAPAAPVSVARCTTYEPKVLVPLMEKMFNQIGGLGRLVKGKTVGIKINLTGNPGQRLGYLPLGDTYWTHPNVITATIHLLGKAGAARVRVLESPQSSTDPLDEYMVLAGWNVQEMANAAKKVEFENTNYLGYGKEYVRMKVPHGGHLFPAYDLNHSYLDCDVFVSISKIKEHATAGVTLAMKNCFGITPCTIYGDRAGEKEPAQFPMGGRGAVVHYGKRPPSLSSPQELDPKSPRQGGYRVPRCVADLAAARPIHLSINEGILSMGVGEGPWISGSLPLAPGVMVIGTNPVCTDAVSTAVMGFDPMADRGKAPFETCDNTMRLAEELGVGTRDLKRIEVVGTPIQEALFDFRGNYPPERRRALDRRRAEL